LYVFKGKKKHECGIKFQWDVQVNRSTRYWMRQSFLVPQPLIFFISLWAHEQKSCVWSNLFYIVFPFIWSMVIVLVEMKKVEKQEMEGKWWKKNYKTIVKIYYLEYQIKNQDLHKIIFSL
jgi:hypothetical protein